MSMKNYEFDFNPFKKTDLVYNPKELLLPGEDVLYLGNEYKTFTINNNGYDDYMIVDEPGKKIVGIKLSAVPLDNQQQ
jgi:hypothetical protein